MNSPGEQPAYAGPLEIGYRRLTAQHLNREPVAIAPVSVSSTALPLTVSALQVTT